MLIKVETFCAQAAEITRLGTATKKVSRELKRAKGTGSIEETKLVSSRAPLASSVSQFVSLRQPI